MMRSAPRATACEIGVLLTIPPSIRTCDPHGTGGNTPGIAALARIASNAGPVESSISSPVMNVGGHDVQRHVSLLEPVDAEVAHEDST